MAQLSRDRNRVLHVIAGLAMAFTLIGSMFASPIALFAEESTPFQFRSRRPQHRLPIPACQPSNRRRKHPFRQNDRHCNWRQRTDQRDCDHHGENE